MIASTATDPTITSTWYQENWSLQTNLCEGTNTKSLNAPPHRVWNSIPRLGPYSVPWNPDVERKFGCRLQKIHLTCTQGSHSQESLLKIWTPSGDHINRLSCGDQLLWSPNVAAIPYTPTNWSRSLLHQYRKPATPDRYYSEYRDSPIDTCLCAHPATMNPKINEFTDRWAYRPEWSRISLGYQFANPPRREMLYLQEESNNLKFGKEDRGNGHFFPQGALINSYPVPSRKPSVGPLPFANWHSTQVFMDTDLFTGDPTASPKCPSNCRDPIDSAPYQTRSRHDDSASPIGSQVFAEYIEKDPSINSEYPRLEPDATRTNPLEQENPEDENLVKERVSSQRVRNTSHARRKVKANFKCHIKSCGSTFTRKKNLECE